MLDDFYQGVNPYTGLPETEEERRKRLGLPALNDVVTSTEIKTYGDGTSEQITKQQIPAQPQPSAPAQPQPAQVAGPVDPATFQRMLEVESGNRQRTAQGQIVTSPRGALGVGQVMPATAAQPGYGVPSIFDLAEQRGIAVPSRDQAGAAQLLGNEQLNREFAQNYANAMTQRFGQQGGVAAYNAGPGRVERNMQANAGQLNQQQLPGETQGYLDRVLGGVRRGAQAVANAVIPSAQAAELTPDQIRQQALAQRQQQQQPQPAQPAVQAAPAATPVAPQANIARPSLATPGIVPDQTAPALGQGLRMPGMPMTQPAAQPSTQAIDLYQQNQDNPEALMKMRGDTNLPSFIRERASKRAYDLLDSDIKKQQAQAQAQQLTAAAAQGDRRAGLTVARELQNQEGSYLKMILLSYLSPELAGEEAVKLGIGNKWTTAYDADGNAGLVEVSARGRPLRGTKADGSEMSKTDLIRYAAGTGERKSFEMPQTLGSPVVKEVVNADGTRSQIGGVRMYDPRTRSTYVQVGKERMPDVNWVTTGQAPGAVYGAGFAREAGSQAAQGYTPPAGPGVPGAAPAQPAPAVQAQPAPAGAVTQPVAPAATPAQPAPAVQAQPAAQPAGAIPPLTGPAAQKAATERAGKEREAVVKSNQEFSTELNKARQSGVAQKAIIDRLQTAVDRNPAFWGIDTNSTVWRAFVDINSTNEKRAEALNSLARNLNIPNDKRAEFDQVMNDYRSLQVNAITSSGLTASQTNSEKESQRVVSVVGSISDKPAAAKATLEYAKAKIAYTEAKARAWNEARKKPGADYVDFEIEFDKTQGEKIFADANKRMNEIIGAQPGAGAGRTSSGNTFRRVQ